MDKDTDQNKRPNKNNTESGAYLVCQGATCLCSAGSSGPVQLKITSQNKVYVNEDQLIATVKDNQMMVPVAPFVSCSLSPKAQAGRPCEYKPTSEWEWTSNVGEEHPEINGLKILTENAILKCPAYPGTLSIHTHGQQIDVLEESFEDLDLSIVFAINCLLGKIEETHPDTIIPTITTLKQGNYTAEKNRIVEVPVRVNTLTEFVAEYSEKTKEALYSYWFIRPKTGNETIPLKFHSSEGLLYRQTGNKIAIRIKKAGEYYIESFGQLTYKNGSSKTQLFTECTLLLKVQANQFKTLAITPEPVEQTGSNIEIWCGQPHTLQIETLFELTDEEKASIAIRIEDSDRNLIKRYSSYEDNRPFLINGKCSFDLMPLNEGIYSVSITLLGKPEINYVFTAVRNKLEKSITSDIPSSGKVRPGIATTFEAHLKKPNAVNSLKWYVDNLPQPDEHGLTFNYTFGVLGKHKIHASLFQLFGGESKTGTYEVDVRYNAVESLTVNASGTELTVGKTITFSADTVFHELLRERKEGIIWKVKVTNPSAAIKGKKPLEIKSAQEQNGQFPDGAFQYGEETHIEKELKIQFNQIGEYEISACIGKTPLCPPKKIKIAYAHIEEWKFVDSGNMYRKHIGWGQEFYLFLKVKGWEKMKIALQLWYDRGKGDIKNRFIKIDTTELKDKKIETDADGACKLKISPDSFWSAFEKVKDNNILFPEDKPAFFFTALLEDTLCDNWKQVTYDGLGGHIFPQKTDGTYAYVPLKTTYRGVFADANGNTLKSIIQYEDTAKIVVWIDNSKGDSFRKNRYKLYLIENKMGKDFTYPPSEQTFDAEGKMEYTLAMDYLKSLKPQNHPKHLPRIFYFELKQIVKNSIEASVYLYPEGYHTGKENDANLIFFDKDDCTPEDMKAQEEQMQQWYACSTFDFLDTSRRAQGGNVSTAQLSAWEKQEAELCRQAEMTASERREKQAEAKNAQAEQSNADKLRKNLNYFLQLKIAEEAGSENSRYTRTAKKIGQALTYEKENRPSDCPRCRAAVRGSKSEWEKSKNKANEACLKDIFPDVSDEVLNKVANTYTKHMERLGMATCWIKAHFFAQAAVETGYRLDINTGENMNFSKQQLYDTFPSKFFKGEFKSDKKWQSIRNQDAEYRHTDNREFKDKAHAEKADKLRNISDRTERLKAIANFVYANTNGNGDEASGDGWRFRGSGLVQLTGRGNFKEIYEEIKSVWPESILTDEGADKVRTNLELAVLTAMGYFKVRKANAIANKTDTDKKISEVCKIVGNNTAAYDNSMCYTLKKQFFKEKSSVIFRTRDCLWREAEIPPLPETEVITYYIIANERKVVKKYPKYDKHPNIRKYIYIDKSGNTHHIAQCELKYATLITHYSNKKKSEILEKLPEANEEGKVELVYIKDFKGYLSKDDKVKAEIKKWDSKQQRYYINPECFAGILGAMLDLNIDFMAFRGSSTIDGTGGESITHNNGLTTDIAYFNKSKTTAQVLLDEKELDLQLNVDFINALIDYGYRDVNRFYTEKFVPYGATDGIKRFLVEGMNKCETPPHDNHLHIGGFDFSTVQIQK